MRKSSILFDLIILSLSIHGFSQNYLIPAQNSQWGELTSLGPPGLTGADIYGSIYYYNGEDTIINKQTYQFWPGVYTRYNDNKLIMIDPYRSQPDSIIEVVYYDFNLAENDSFLLPLPYDSLYAIVKEISSFTALNGQTRKKIRLATKDFICTPYMEWIEGVGDIMNGIFYMNQLGMCDINNRIVCFSDSSGSVYQAEDFTYPCDSLDHYVQLFDSTNNAITYDTNLKPAVKIYPNPVSEQLFIETDYNLERIRVLNMHGQVMIESKDKVIDCFKLSKGLYLLELKKNNNTIEVIEFIKK